MEVNVLPAAIEAANANGGLVLAQASPGMPVTYGDATIPLDRQDYLVEADDALAYRTGGHPDDMATDIGPRDPHHGLVPARLPPSCTTGSTTISASRRCGPRRPIERWFLAATLFGNRIATTIAMRTYRVLHDAGVTAVGRAGAATGRAWPSPTFAGRCPHGLLHHVADMAAQVDIAIVTPHWGRNMTTAPEPHVRAAAQALRQAGADLVAGHSAHVFHGVAGPVLFDLGDFIDDYRREPELRNDLGLLFIVTVDKHGPIGLEAVPIGLDFGHTRLARPDEADWIRHRFTTASDKLGTTVTATGDGRLAVVLR